MATLSVRLSDLATRIATECKALRTFVNGNAADLSALATTNKSNLVAALNELKADLQTIAGSTGASINDGASSSGVQTWSVNKIVEELAATAAALKDEILGGAGAAADTLKELADLLGENAADITTLLTAIGTRVRFDEAQVLTAQQKQIARSNIGADITSAEIGNPDTNYVTIFNNGLA